MPEVERYNTVRCGKESLRIVGPQIWNSLPNEYKTVTNKTVTRPLQMSGEPVEGSNMLM